MQKHYTIFCHLPHRRLKFYVLTHNNPKNPEYLIAISFVIAGKRLDLSIFDNFGAQLQAPVLTFSLLYKLIPSKQTNEKVQNLNLCLEVNTKFKILLILP